MIYYTYFFLLKGLEQLQEDLSVLEVLVYEVGLVDMFLEDIEQLNTLEKASLFMSRVCNIKPIFSVILFKIKINMFNSVMKMYF